MDFPVSARVQNTMFVSHVCAISVTSQNNLQLMLHVNWNIFDFNKNELGTISTHVISRCCKGMNVCMKSLIKLKLLSKKFQSVTVDHRYTETRQLLSSFKFLHTMRTKGRMPKIAVTEKCLPLTSLC